MLLVAHSDNLCNIRKTADIGKLLPGKENCSSKETTNGKLL